MLAYEVNAVGPILVIKVTSIQFSLQKLFIYLLMMVLEVNFFMCEALFMIKNLLRTILRPFELHPAFV